MTSSAKHLGRRALVLWIGLVRRFAVAVLALATLATAAALTYVVGHVGINTSTTDMLSERLAFRQNALAMDLAFPQLDGTLSIVIDAQTAEEAEDAAERLVVGLRARPAYFRSVFYPDGHPFFRRNGLLYLELSELGSLADRLAEAQPLLAWLNEDMSLVGFAEALRLAVENAEQSPAMVSALGGLTETVQAVSEGRPARLSWRELISGEPARAEDRRKFVIVQPVLDFASLEPAAAALDAVRALVEELNLTVGRGVTVRLSGSLAMFQDELRSLREGMGFVGLLSIGLVIGLLTIGLGSPRLILATLAALLMGLIWTAFFATAAIGELNLISVAFAVLFIGLSVDFGIHYSLRYKEAIGDGDDGDVALGRAAEGVGGALTLCAVAAAIGFFSFLPTDYRGLSELGLISGTGMFIALFANLTVLPAILALFPLRPGAARSGGFTGARAQAVVERHARPILAGALVLGLAAAATLPFARFDDDPLNLRDPESESVATLLDLLDDPRVSPYDATLLTPDLDVAAARARSLRALPEVDRATTLLDFVPQDQDRKLEIVEDMAVFLTGLLLPAERAPPPTPLARRQAVEKLRVALAAVSDGPLAAPSRRLAEALGRLDGSDEILKTLELALIAGLPRRLEALAEALSAEPVGLLDLPSDLRARALAGDGRAIVRVTPAEDLRDRDARLRFVAAIQEVAPGATGAAITITEAGAAVVAAFRQAALTAVILIGLLLLALLRSLRDSLLVLAPIFLAAALTVAVTVLAAQPFNFANVIVLPLLFGLGVASGIHIVVRDRKEAAGRLMRTSTPRAVVFSALTTIGSFGALGLSSHPGTASMGLLLTIAIGTTMLSTLIVLPALLAAFARRERRRSPGPAAR